MLTELLAVRIRFFGNILRELVPGASLDCGDLRAVMCRTASRNAYLQYVAGTLLGRQWKIDGIDLVSCSEVVCRLPEKGDGRSEDRVYVEADGELLGRLPARMTMVPDALSLIVPPQQLTADSLSSLLSTVAFCRTALCYNSRNAQRSPRVDSSVSVPRD